MTKRRFPVWAWLFAAWTLFIFLRSLQPADASEQESGWALALLLRLFPFPWLTAHRVRKAAHFTEFAVLGVLSEPLGRGPLYGGGPRLARLAAVWFSLSLCAAAALSDETIQLFIAGRSGQVSDVWLDISGAAFALALSVPVRAAAGWVRTARTARRREKDGTEG